MLAGEAHYRRRLSLAKVLSGGGAGRGGGRGVSVHQVLSILSHKVRSIRPDNLLLCEWMFMYVHINVMVAL